jgi:hypothetical protein
MNRDIEGFNTQITIQIVRSPRHTYSFGSRVSAIMFM